jgi:hypothetical protein
MPPRKKVIVPSETTGENPIIDVPKKRERKSKKQSVVAIVTPDGIQGNFITETKRPLIVHLPVHSADIKFHDQPLMYDPTPPTQPEAYDASIMDPFFTEATYEGISTPENIVEKKEEPVHQSLESIKKEYGPAKLLVQNLSSKKEYVLPDHTEVACFWCCDQVEGRPCIIPLTLVEDIWHVYGNFCMPQCAMAYLLSEILDTHVRWERIALLNRLYGFQYESRIYPAPNRETLQRFGGTLSYPEFHKLCDDQKVRVDVHMPPMVSILASMDTKPIDFYETPIRQHISPNQFQVKQEDTSLKLRRTKPLKSKESTLDACLQIKIKSKA